MLAAFDTVLVLMLLWVAWRLLASPDLFKAIVLFIVFGLLMALVWSRLQAPDVALAEAAIGAGLTGALMLAALRRLPAAQREAAEDDRAAAGAAALRALLVAALAGGLAVAVMTLPATATGLRAAVQAQLPVSGAQNPVTAVLLNFRGYDTLLEIGVLLLAALGMRSLGVVAHLPALPTTGPVLHAFTRLLVPSLVLIAGYLLWLGSHAPGGAFQGGALLAAAGVLMLLSERAPLHRLSEPALRLLSVLGFAFFLTVAVATLLFQGHLLQYPVAWAGMLLWLIEAVALPSIATILMLLFAGGRLSVYRPPGGDRP